MNGWKFKKWIHHHNNLEDKTMDYSKKIYKQDSKGRVRVLHVYTEGADLIQESGLIEGQLVKHESTCIAKNVGKANETTAIEQALAEANSKIMNKMSTGYFHTIEEAEESSVILPMLAKNYNDEAHKVEYPCYAQPKLDGMRALGYSDDSFYGFISRKGKEIYNMDHIAKELSQIKLNAPLDGELYAHGKSFQENMRLIKKYRPNETEEIKYHVYDYADPNMSFKQRLEVLENLEIMSQTANMPWKHIKIVPTIIIESEADLKQIHPTSLKMGYEGTIVRWGNAGYKSKSRSSNLLKYKDFQDLTCKIVDVEPSVKRPEQGQFICEYKGVTFGCGMKFSHQERKNILINASDYIGQTAEIRFFEYSEDGIPRFPVCVGIRLDK